MMKTAGAHHGPYIPARREPTRQKMIAIGVLFFIAV